MSSLSVAGDFSGLTATGRPISGGAGQGRRQMTRYVRSMFSQQINAGASPSRGITYNMNMNNPGGNHGNNMMMKSPSGYHYTRQLSGNSNQDATTLNLDRPGNGIAVEPATLSHSIDEPSSGKFVTNFFQTHLSGGSASGGGGGGGGGGGVSVGGARGGQGRGDKGEYEEKSTVATEEMRYKKKQT